MLASFASGYHLVMKTAPQSMAPTPEEGRATSAPASASGAAAVAQSGNGAASGAAGRPSATTSASNPSDPAEAIVRPNLRPDRARVRSRPDAGAIVGRLPSNQRVTLLGRDGQWLHIAFDRNGKHIDGWTQEANLLLR